MRNWSRHIHWQPSQIAYPVSEQEVLHLVQQAIEQKRKVRIVGSAHSFNPLWVNNDLLVSLDQYQGLISVDQNKLQVTVKAGTKLHYLGELLFEQGLAMENLGDIDAQSIGGTIGTGTHGTGLAFGSISTQVVALKIINGRGELIECSANENKELFKSAQVSLGALGIITEITLQCVPAYRLALINKNEALDTALDNFRERIETNRNVEFYWFPYTQKAWTKTSNIVEETADKVGLANYLTEYVLENYAFKVLCEYARYFPSQNAQVAKISAASIPNLKKVYHSHKVYATQRLVRFNEMEYSVPLAAHRSVLKEIIRLFERKRFRVHFPIENRVVKADDIPLSPAFARDSAYIACHVYHKKAFQEYFKELEAIFLDHEGRPHWGKMHTQRSSDLSSRYPLWEAFQEQRMLQDPEGLFMNDYLEKLFL